MTRAGGAACGLRGEAYAQMEDLVLAFVSLELVPVDAADSQARELRDYFAAMAVTIVDACLTAELEVRGTAGADLARNSRPYMVVGAAAARRAGLWIHAGPALCGCL